MWGYLGGQFSISIIDYLTSYLDFLEGACRICRPTCRLEHLGVLLYDIVYPQIRQHIEVRWILISQYNQYLRSEFKCPSIKVSVNPRMNSW